VVHIYGILVGGHIPCAATTHTIVGLLALTQVWEATLTQ